MCLCSGGAFYTPETIDTARLHYRSSWATVLHAVALWLSSTGFGADEEKEEVPSALSKAHGLPQGAPTTTKNFEEAVKDRMHLMLGKEMHIHNLWCRALTVFVLCSGGTPNILRLELRVLADESNKENGMNTP